MGLIYLNVNIMSYKDHNRMNEVDGRFFQGEKVQFLLKEHEDKET